MGRFGFRVYRIWLRGRVVTSTEQLWDSEPELDLN